MLCIVYGYCLEASMTGRGIGWCWFVLFHPLLPVSGTGTGFDSSVIKGEGDSVGCFGLLLPRTPCPVVSRLRGNDGVGDVEGDWRLCCLVVVPDRRPPCGYCLEASMTGRGIWLVLVCCLVALFVGDVCDLALMLIIK